MSKSGIPKVTCGFVQVLPTAFGDELSYYEQVCRLAKTINEVLDYLERMTDESKAYTDSKVAEATAALRKELITKLEVVKRELESEIALLRVETDTKLDAQDADIQSFKTTINKRVDGFDGLIDLRIKANNKYLYELINQGLGTLYVINPITGERDTIQAVLDFLASFHLENAITVAEMESRGATCDEIVVADFTVLELIQNGINVYPIGA